MRASFISSAKANDGIPITKHSIKNMLIGTNGYCCAVKIQKPTINITNKVLNKKIDDVRWILLITRRPWATTLGIEAKLLSIKTRWLTFRAASEPAAIAIEQSASRSAKISFTPSPVIATVRPAFLNSLTNISFCSGLTRPKTVYSFATLRTSIGAIPSSETYLSAPSIPARRATSETVIGLSPEITRISTPFCLNQSIVAGASERIWSWSVKIATAFASFGIKSFLSCPLLRAKTKTRYP